MIILDIGSFDSQQHTILLWHDGHGIKTTRFHLRVFNLTSPELAMHYTPVTHPIDNSQEDIISEVLSEIFSLKHCAPKYERTFYPNTGTYRQLKRFIDTITSASTNISFLKGVCSRLAQGLPKSHAQLNHLLDKEATRRQYNHAARCIQHYWRRVIADPTHPICQRRLLYEFYECSPPCPKTPYTMTPRQSHPNSLLCSTNTPTESNVQMLWRRD